RHPAHALRHYPGRRQRDEVARHHHAGVAVRGGDPLGRVALEYRHLETALAQVVGASQADDARADDHHVAAHPIPQANSSSGSITSVPSTMTCARPVMTGNTLPPPAAAEPPAHS